MSTRLVSVDELVTVDEIAKRLRMSLNSASNLVRGRQSKHSSKFPMPIVGRGVHGVWLWDDVEAWCAESGRSTLDDGNPPPRCNKSNPKRRAA